MLFRAETKKKKPYCSALPYLRSPFSLFTAINHRHSHQTSIESYFYIFVLTPAWLSLWLLASCCLAYTELDPKSCRMLAAPAKSAKRLSSLFSLGSNRDAEEKNERTSSVSQPTSRRSSAGKPPVHPNHPPPNPPLRHAASQQHLSTPGAGYAPRNVSAPLPREPLRDDPLLPPLLPPPSLSTINADVADNSGDSGRKRQSWGGIPKLTSALSRPSSRAGPPQETGNQGSSHGRGLSWVPSKSRGGSVDSTVPQSKMRAWIAGIEAEVPYDLAPLLGGEKVRMK